MRQRCSLKTAVVIWSWLLASMPRLTRKTRGSSDVAENADNIVRNRAWANVYQSPCGSMILRNVHGGRGGQILHFMMGKRLFSKRAIGNEEDPRAFLRLGFWASLRAQSRLNAYVSIRLDNGKCIVFSGKNGQFATCPEVKF